MCKNAALSLGLKYIDSGALYRAITWLFLSRGLLGDGISEDALSGVVITQRFLPDGRALTFVNGEDVSDRIRDEEIARHIGRISDNTGIRDYVNRLLRSWAGSESIMMDGRDIGSVVFPDADMKIYLDASVEERTRRRIKEYREMGKNVDEIAIKNQIILRDEQDRSRSYGRLIRCDDAVYIDTSHMSQDEVESRIRVLAEKIIA